MMYGMSLLRSASLNFFFPVGLIRSPIKTGRYSGPKLTVFELELITQLFFLQILIFVC
ncbi:MAG: hypothetical protein IJZ27_03890 [Treponema sp.]|nr:hypothetical protein [Treponema sp.]